MNKQQLAAKIWASANKMRSNKIEVQDYKDYILGFIFYKYLSDTEVKKLRELGMSDEDMKSPLKPPPAARPAAHPLPRRLPRSPMSRMITASLPSLPLPLLSAAASAVRF